MTDTKLVLDTESFFCTHCKQRRLLSIAWFSIHDGSVGRMDVCISVNCHIDTRSQKIHGSQTNLARAHGHPIEAVLQRLVDLLTTGGGAMTIISHDVQADLSLLVNEALLLQHTRLLALLINTDTYCTKLKGASICRLSLAPDLHRRGVGGWKWPSLSDLHAYLIGGVLPSNHHDPEIDVDICLSVYRKLVQIT